MERNITNRMDYYMDVDPKAKQHSKKPKEKEAYPKKPLRAQKIMSRFCWPRHRDEN